MLKFSALWAETIGAEPRQIMKTAVRGCHHAGTCGATMPAPVAQADCEEAHQADPNILFLSLTTKCHAMHGQGLT